MLWLEREVVASLSADVDPAHRAAIEAYVEGVLSDMPDHLRLGVAGESVVLGTGIRLARMVGSRRSLQDWLDLFERNPIGPIRQYARLLSSLTIFAIEELAPTSAGYGRTSSPAATGTA
jgi:hypothetical protein